MPNQTARLRRLVVPGAAGLILLVGCGEAAANETCQQLQDLEQRIIDVDPDADDVNALLADVYDDVAALAEETDGELGEALNTMQPVFDQFEALIGDDEQAAIAAQQAQAEQSEEGIAAIDEAANYINETCDLSVLL